MNLPKDPAMLCSLINLKLRDEYDSLDELCREMEIDKMTLLGDLQRGGFIYDHDHNRFR